MGLYYTLKLMFKIWQILFIRVLHCEITLQRNKLNITELTDKKILQSRREQNFVTQKSMFNNK